MRAPAVAPAAAAVMYDESCDAVPAALAALLLPLLFLSPEELLFFELLGFELIARERERAQRARRRESAPIPISKGRRFHSHTTVLLARARDPQRGTKLIWGRSSPRGRTAHTRTRQ